MGLDPTEEIGKAVGKFPFAMAATSIFFGGCVFVLFNGPLVILLLSNKTFANAFTLLNDGILATWRSALQTSSSVFSITVFLLLSFIAGVIITPFERLFVTVTVLPVSIAARKIKRFRTLHFFTPREMLADDYENILGWLLSKPPEKSHWEWELFNYYIYWSIATSTFIFSAISIYLLRTSISLWEFIIFLLLTGIFFGFALLHSIMMGKVHNRYRKNSSQVPHLFTK